MRISVDSEDPGFLPEGHPDLDCDVFLNGEKQDAVITADEEIGLIHRYMPVDTGALEFEIGADGMYELKSEVVYGHVEIVPRKK